MTKVFPSKDELERQKLALEILDLQRRWWQRPAYLSILVPIVLGGLTILAGILSGYFDRERIELKRDNQALKDQNAALVQTRAAIQDSIQNKIQLLKQFRDKGVKALQDGPSEPDGIPDSPTPTPPGER